MQLEKHFNCKRNIIFAFALIFFATGAIASVCVKMDTQGDCQEGFHLFKGKCYRLYPEERNFIDAEKFCNNLSYPGHLASYHSEEEFNFLQDLISGQGQVWFGGTDQAEEGTWVFTDGTVIDYFGTGWVESGGVNENCARFQPAPWDIHCSSQFKYICMTSPAQVTEPWKSLISGNCLEPETVFPSSASFSTTFQLNYNTDACSTYSDNQVEISITFNETVACNDAKILHVLDDGGDCKKLRPCSIATGTIGTTCSYLCSCNEAETSCDLLLTNENLYKEVKVPNLCKIELIPPST